MLRARMAMCRPAIESSLSRASGLTPEPKIMSKLLGTTKLWSLEVGTSRHIKDFLATYKNTRKSKTCHDVPEFSQRFMTCKRFLTTWRSPTGPLVSRTNCQEFQMVEPDALHMSYQEIIYVLITENLLRYYDDSTFRDHGWSISLLDQWIMVWYLIMSWVCVKFYDFETSFGLQLAQFCVFFACGGLIGIWT